MSGRNRGKQPSDLVKLWNILVALNHGAGAISPSSGILDWSIGGIMPYLRLSNAHRDLIAEIYAASGATVDDLPYTDEFERLYAAFILRSGCSIDRHDFWKALAGLRKASRLVRKRR